jgi:formate-dependent nitrite reductase membrane component NrfD
MRRLPAACLVAAPLFLLASEAAAPALTDDGRDSVVAVATEPGALTAWIWLGIAAAVLLIPAIGGAALWLRGRGRVVGGVGAALALVGAVGYAVHQATFLYLPALVGGDTAEMAGVYERQGEHGTFALVTFGLFLGPLMIGLLLLGVGLSRSGVAPWWPVVAIVLAVLPSVVPLPFDTGPGAYVLLATGMAGWAWSLLRTDRVELVPAGAARA